MGSFFDFSDEELQAAYAEEAFIADIQYDISRMLKEQAVTRSELARRLRVSPAMVSQMLGDGGSNLTSRTIARIYRALGEEPSICAKRHLGEAATTYEAEAKASGWMGVAASPCTEWRSDGSFGAASFAGLASRGGENVIWLDAVRKAA